jgi:hypothetical protein
MDGTLTFNDYENKDIENWEKKYKLSISVEKYKSSKARR